MPTVKTKTKVKQPRIASVPGQVRRARVGRVQFAYMKAPGAVYAFEVGGTVEVFCDHEKNSERVRGWSKALLFRLTTNWSPCNFAPMFS